MSLKPRVLLPMIALTVPLAGGCASVTDRAQGQTTTSTEARSNVASAAATPAATPRTPRIPSGVTAGYLVFDRREGKATAQYHAHRRFRSASVVKILIALDYLRSRKPGTAIPAADLALLQPMLRSSDDHAASTLWKRGGQRKIIQRMASHLKLADTAPPPASKPGFWGYTAISAADVVKIYRYLLDDADPKHRDFILGHLRQATKCAADGFDQYFGIPSAVPRPWAVKQGWSGYGSIPPVKCATVRANTLAPTARTHGDPPINLARPVLHTTGLVGKDDRFIMAVLTLQPAGASWRTSVARLTALTKDVYLSGRAG